MELAVIEWLIVSCYEFIMGGILAKLPDIIKLIGKFTKDLL